MQLIFVNNNDLLEWCDVVFTQLIGCSYGYNKAKQHNKKMLFISHNYGKHYFLTDKTAVLYNSFAMQAANLYPDVPNTVLQPLVEYVGKHQNPTKIALINCNENKGVLQFIELAKMLPQYEFLGIKGGYGQQITPDVPNITWQEHGVIDWSCIRILLVPSVMESWSQVATEAICNGIPVICSDLAGLRENLKDCALYIKENNIPLYAEYIETLMSDNEIYEWYSQLSLDRAKELHPLPRVKAFNDWLIKFVEQ